MSGNRKCTKCRKVTIPGGDRMCQPCELNSMIDQITTMNMPEITPDFRAVCKNVMETHKGTLQKLAADEANECKAKASLSSGSAHELPTYLAQRGTKHDEGKPDLSLVPKSGLEAAARAFEYGVGKYSRFNFRKGFAYSRLIAAAMRHLTAWYWESELDEESGNSHLSHALAAVMMLIEVKQLGTGTDDRAYTGAPKLD